MMHANPQTKEKLINATLQLMLAKGYTATSIDEICNKAHITKGGLFHYFDSKEDLGKAALERFYSSQDNLFKQAPFQRQKDPLKRLFGYVDFLIQVSTSPSVIKSCLVGNFSQELAPTQPDFRSLCNGYFSDWTCGFAKLLDEAKAKYPPKKKFDSQSVSDYLVTAIEGSLILYKAKQETKVIEENLMHYKKYLKSLFI